MTCPVVRELDKNLKPVEVFRRLSRLSHVVFFDSALKHDALGRYSFVAADPFEWIELSEHSDVPFESVETQLDRYPTSRIPELPPFQGGAAGLFGYELGHALEDIPLAAHNEFQTPSLAVGFYDVVVAFDHLDNRAWIVSQGFPETDGSSRRERGEARLREFVERIESNVDTSPAGIENDYAPVDRSQLARQHALPHFDGLLSDFSADAYRNAVQSVVDYIHAGDVFQVNLSQRLLFPRQGSSVDLFLRLRERNAATFSGFFDVGPFQICSASPERFLAVRDRKVETRPIKGTRSRSSSPEADLFTGDELRHSAKDRAENVMIVDLLRNDLSRVCEPDSVRVTQLCGLETYAYVQHLVSAVEGRLEDGQSALSALQASFPGGSITGAPKVRAMEIITELEPTARGPYCGSLGYVGFDGTADSSILIRTITAGRGWWQLPVGGGIVADSNPQDEYEETWHKAAGLLKALLP